MYKYQHCTSENAPKFLDWIRNRGGVAVWNSADLSAPGLSWSTPALAPDGTPTPKPTWQAADAPAFIINDPLAIEVCEDHEVKRFRVSIRRGSQGLSWKCSDASSARIRREVAKAGLGAYYEFDYGTQECVILAPHARTSLAEWSRNNPQP